MRMLASLIIALVLAGCTADDRKTTSEVLNTPEVDILTDIADDVLF